MARRGALQVLAERSGSDSDECMFDQTNLLERRRTDITRVGRDSSAMSGRRLTVARTVNLCLSFFALGLCFAMPTATITGLQYRTSSSESAIGNIYRARYGGYIVGSFAGGFLFNCYNRQFLLFLALLATAIGVFVMPFCRALAILMTCTCVTGITMGLLDTGGNVWLLDLWGRKSAPFMQTMHFCFGLGALVAPMVAQPFIGPYNQLGPRNASNETHTILLPISIRSSNNPYAERMYTRAAEISRSIRSISLDVSTNKSSGAMLVSTTEPLPPTKPHFTDQAKEFSPWERKPVAPSVAPSLNATLRAVNATSRPMITSTTTQVPSKVSHVAVSNTTPCSTCINGKDKLPSTETSSPVPHSSPSSIHRDLGQSRSDIHIGETLKPVHRVPSRVASTSTLTESTTKKTASTVPTEGTLKTITSSSDDTLTTAMKKHSSIKKKILDDSSNLSWLQAARNKIQESGKFEIAYGILAAYVLIVSIVFLAFLYMNPREGRSKQEEEVDGSNGAQAFRMRILLVGLMCSFFFLYMGIEAAVGETLKSLFERGDLITQVISGEQLVYIFWGSFAFARAVSIFVSVKVSYRAMLVIDILVCLIASVMLVLGRKEAAVIVAGIVLLAFGMASIIPTLFIWLERCIQVSNRHSSLLILSSAAGEMLIPEIASIFTRKTPMALTYVILNVLLLCSVNLAALCWVTSVRGEKYVVKPDRSLYQLASLDEDIEHWSQAARKAVHQRDVVKRNKNNSFFYNRLNNLDS